MKEFRKIGVKLLSLGALLVVLNLCYTYIQFPLEKEFLSPYSQMLESARDADVIYLGDCSDVYSKQGDTVSAVHDYLAQRYPEFKIAAISDVGFQPNSFLQIMHALESRGNLEGKRIVLTLNLRAFAPHIMYDRFYTPVINRSLLLTQNGFSLFNRARITLKDYDQVDLKTVDEQVLFAESKVYEKANSNYLSQKDWIVKANLPEEKMSYLSDFAFELNEDHPWLADFDEIAKLSLAHNVELIYFIAPINHEKVKEHFGESLSEMVDQNLIFLKNRYDQYPVIILDRSHMLPAKFFIETKSNSHLTDEGKQLLGNSIRWSKTDNL